MALSLIEDLPQKETARAIRLRSKSPPILHLITDASLQGGRAGLGAALVYQKVDGSLRVKSWMRKCLAPDLLPGHEAGVYGLEAAAVALALGLFKPR